MAEPMEHVERLRPPWRTVRLTECGRSVDEFRTVLSTDEFVTKVKAQGKQRAAMSTCMTCWHKAEWTYRRDQQSWYDDPPSLAARDVDRRRDLFAAELRALAVLYERHADEYHEIIDALAETSDLREARAARAARAAWGGE